MPNSYFNFKQFRIEQGNCGMKVSTDACIQGAWTPVPDHALRILDAGAGTGLLSLMLAQRFPRLEIDALELDPAAAEQAAANAQSSPFSGNINTIHADARTWHTDRQYNGIICNPPFFVNSLISQHEARTNARHDASLKQEDLLQLFDRVLTHNGFASVLLPLAESQSFVRLASGYDWFPEKQLHIRDNPRAAVKRVITILKRTIGETTSEELTIKDQDGHYTAAFSHLLQPFYLHL